MKNSSTYIDTEDRYRLYWLYIIYFIIHKYCLSSPLAKNIIGFPEKWGFIVLIWTGLNVYSPTDTYQIDCENRKGYTIPEVYYVCFYYRFVCVWLLCEHIVRVRIAICVRFVWSTGCSLKIVFFLKYYDFSELCKFCCHCVHTLTTRENLERPESGIYFKILDKTQYLMNTLYVHIV